MAPHMILLEVLAKAKQKTSWSIQIQFYVLWKAELDAFVHWLEILEYWADVKTRDCHPLTCRIFFWVREDLLKTLRFPVLPSFLPPVHHSAAIFPSPRYFTPFPSPVQIFYKYVFSSTKNFSPQIFSPHFFSSTKKIFSLYKCFPSFLLHSSSRPPNKSFPLSKYFLLFPLHC